MKLHKHTLQNGAMTNVTEDLKKTKTVVHLLCSLDFSDDIEEPLTYLSVLNIFLSISAVLCKESSLHPPSKLLLRCLATTDLCVGLIVQPLAITFWMSLVKKEWDLCRKVLATAYVVSYIVCPVTMLTLAVISVDRLLALSLGLRYKQVVTLKQTYVIVAIVWTVSTVAAVLALINYLIMISYGYVVVSFCVVIIFPSYIKIFLTLRRHQAQVQVHVQQEQPSQINPLNVARYRKAVSSALWVQFTFFVCCLPHTIVKALFDSNNFFIQVSCLGNNTNFLNAKKSISFRIR